jgi:hypothetical protein
VVLYYNNSIDLPSFVFYNQLKVKLETPFIMSKLPDEAFRDTIGTIDDEGKRKFIFPKKAVGKIL